MNSITMITEHNKTVRPKIHFHLFSVACGIFVGYVIGVFIYTRYLACCQHHNNEANDSQDINCGFRAHASYRHQQMDGVSTGTHEPSLVLIGVMTTKSHLHSRVLALRDTWLKSIPGRVIFFSSEGSEVVGSNLNVEIVGLKGVGDEYPPQKKSFMMLKYMYEHFLDDFRFFMRADDDVYIRGELLEQLLCSINSSNALFIGQTGLGSKQEVGQLSLRKDENFCMGGTGMILSRETLVRTVPHINSCLQNLYTAHEDVEIGRCITKFSTVPCTWAYEAQKIFYNNYREPNGSFTHQLNDAELDKAITLHPIKNSTYLYRLHQHFLMKDLRRLRNELYKVQRDIRDVATYLTRGNLNSMHRSQSFMLKTGSLTRNDTMVWDFISRSLYSVSKTNPKLGFNTDLRLALIEVIGQVMKLINVNVKQKGRFIEYKDLLYGYQHVNPLIGAHYVLDMLLLYRKFKGKRRLNIPVRRHAYIRQPFLEPEFEETGPVTPMLLKTKSPRKSSENNATKINFILPLCGRHKTFVQFMSNFDRACLQTNETVSLTAVVVCQDDKNQTAEVVTVMERLRRKYAQHDLKVVVKSHEFSRGLALQWGSDSFKGEDLLVFIDVDISLSADALRRIRLNTVLGAQVYYPVVFSEYDSSYLSRHCRACSISSAVGEFGPNTGYWRIFGFGIVATYKQDFDAVGGFDLNIKGWGKEDVDLLERYVAHNITVFRAMDIGLRHVFHEITCSGDLDTEQHRMCLGSKAASLASTDVLAKSFYATLNER